MITARGVVFTALATADALLATAGKDRERRLTKPLLMPVLMPGRSAAAQRALALSWAGDIALLGSGDAAFQAGLASFLASHLAWISALRRRQGAGRLRAGGMLFLASDSLLALRKFGLADVPGGEGLVMASYAAAQALLARSVG